MKNSKAVIGVIIFLVVIVGLAVVIGSELSHEMTRP